MYVQLQYRLLWQQTAAADNSCNAAFLITALVHTLTNLTNDTGRQTSLTGSLLWSTPLLLVTLTTTPPFFRRLHLSFSLYFLPRTLFDIAITHLLVAVCVQAAQKSSPFATLLQTMLLLSAWTNSLKLRFKGCRENRLKQCGNPEWNSVVRWDVQRRSVVGDVGRGRMCHTCLLSLNIVCDQGSTL